MSAVLTARAMAIVVGAILVAAGASFFILSEFPTSGNRCNSQTRGLAMLTFNGRTYCSRTMTVGAPVSDANGTGSGPVTNESFLGFGFSFCSVVWGDNGGLAVTITEPNGTSFFGGPYFTSVRGELSTTWFTPDNESGVYEPGFLANASLLVEVGT